MRVRVLPSSCSFSSEAASSSSSANAAVAAPPPPSASASASAPPTRTRTSTRTEEELYLNIYDVSPINHCLYWFGLGIFYSGIEVYGMEYGFGAHEYPTSGVFQVEPKSCPGFIFRRSVCVGTTDMSRSEVHSFIEDLAEDYHGDTYHLIAKNCNHFTADVCERLTGKPIPGWVNRLARLGSFCNCVLPIVEITGSFCNCVLPESINVSAVRDVTAHPGFSGSHAAVEGAAGQLRLSAPSCSVSVERAQGKRAVD